jgi:GNAT superfamily N-acetyltransferase
VFDLEPSDGRCARFEVTDQNINIRDLQDTDSLEELTGLLHRAYGALSEMGLKFLATHQDAGVTRERIAVGRCFVAAQGDEIVGTITYYPAGHGKGSPWLESGGVAHMGQLAVEPKLQGRGIATRLVGHVEQTARRDGARELALDTAEPARHLIAWYERMGYRFIEHVQWQVTNYRSVVMSKTL